MKRNTWTVSETASAEAWGRDLRPLSARSAALSLLLGAEPPELRGADLVRLGETFGISGPTMRVALSRLVAAGELTTADGVYALTDRLAARQKATLAQLAPATEPFDGGWVTAVVVGAGSRSASDRGELRRAMSAARFGELREGVWMRPDNLTGARVERDELVHLTAIPDGGEVAAKALVARLWNLDEWAARAEALVRAFENPDVDEATRLAVAAATVRHLRSDPMLPESLAPKNWPAQRLRRTYDAYRAELRRTVGLSPHPYAAA